MPDQKNLILAIALSILILLTFQFFLAPPPPPGSDQPTVQQPIDGGVDTTGIGGADMLDADGLLTGATSGIMPRGSALEQSARVQIDTARPGEEEGTVRGVHGSIALRGGQLDDLTLAGYRTTVDPNSPEIVLLSPRQSPAPYLVDVGLIGSDGRRLTDGDTLWESDEQHIGIGEPVTLRHTLESGVILEREIQVDENYMFTVTQRVINETNASVSLTPYARIRRFGTPDVLGYFILHEGPYGVFDGTLREYDYDDIIDAEGGRIEYDSTGGWLGFTDKYWLVAIVPDQGQQMQARFMHQDVGGQDQYFAIYQLDQITVPPQDSHETTHNIFAGAKEVAVIDHYQESLGIDNFELAIDFGWFYFLTRPFFTALTWINAVVGNFGIAILIFTVAIKLVFFPLANKSYRAMSKMKALQPEMMQIRERYGEDRQKMQMEMMALYKREKVNPASGCLPILIQIPVFFALYKVLFVTIEMRHAPFFGWIQDLSAPDPTSLFNLFGLLPWDTPTFLTIGIWPLIMGVTMYLQQKVNPAPADPLQQKIFMMLPVVFTFVLATFPAGLVIYWAWNNALSILQQIVIMKRMGVKIGGGMQTPAPAAAAAGVGATGGKNGGPRKKVWADNATGDEAEAADDGGDDGPTLTKTKPQPTSRPRPKKSQARNQSGRRRAGGGPPRRR